MNDTHFIPSNTWHQQRINILAQSFSKNKPPMTNAARRPTTASTMFLCNPAMGNRWATKAAATPSSLDSLLKTSSLFSHKNGRAWTSLVAQWIRIRLAMLGTWVQSLVREAWCGATKLVCRSYCTRRLQLPKSLHLEPTLCNTEKPPQQKSPCIATKRNLHLHSLRLETAHTRQQRPGTTKYKITNK